MAGPNQAGVAASPNPAGKRARTVRFDSGTTDFLQASLSGDNARTGGKHCSGHTSCSDGGPGHASRVQGGVRAFWRRQAGPINAPQHPAADRKSVTEPRRLDARDLGWAHALNQAHAVELADASPEAFRDLAARATVACVLDPEAGFILAFRDPPSRPHPNYDWLIARYPSLLYVDRIVVDARWRRRGLARRLCDEAFAVAQRLGLDCVGCEVNEHPPNIGSDAFHAAMGFSVCGSQRLTDRHKTVRYLIKRTGAQSGGGGVLR